MSAFWTFARRMLRYRLLMAGTLVMVVLAAFSLGIGLLGAAPVLEQLLNPNPKTLAQFAEEFNQRTANLRWQPLTRPITIPQNFINALPTDPYISLVWIISALAVLAVVGSITNFLHAYLANTVVNRTITHIRREAFRAVIRQPLARVINDGAADAVSRIVNDTRALGDGLMMLLSKAVLQAFKGVAGLAAALFFDWKVTLTALLAGPLLYTIIRKLGKRIKKASKAVLVSQGALYASATSTVQGLRAVKVNTAERLEAGRFHRINKRTLREMNRVRTARALASPLTEMLSIFLLCGLVLVTGYFIIRRGVFDPGVFIMVISSLAVAGASLKPLTGIVNDIQASAPAADRIAELLAAAPEKGHDRRLPKLLRHAKAIEFRQVSLQYENAPRPAIDGVSITIPHGRRIAVVGPNGCGKTSLLSLVPRLFAPSSGSVLIDDVDISTVSLRSLRAQIGVVTQETTLFRGTIRENIAYGAEGVTDDRVIDAARRAHAHEFIMSLPLAYETEVAEQGLSLSGGQRQRLSIARAILRDPAILILDEATSMIDAESEAHIGAALNEFSQGRTCLIVAHRLATVVNADRIMVMDSGKIVDSGTHAELLTRCETYRSLVQHQFGIVLGASGNIESEFGRFAAAGTNGTGLVEPAIVPTMM